MCSNLTLTVGPSAMWVALFDFRVWFCLSNMCRCLLQCANCPHECFDLWVCADIGIYILDLVVNSLIPLLAKFKTTLVGFNRGRVPQPK